MGCKSKLLKKAIKAKNSVVLEAVDRVCRYLAIATGNMINTISSDLVMYGGRVVEAVGNVFLKKIIAQVDRCCMTSIRPTVELMTAASGVKSYSAAAHWNNGQGLHYIRKKASHEKHWSKPSQLLCQS